MERIREILVDTRPEYDFFDEVDFIEEGMLDSFDVITLVTELEETFNIQIDGADIIPENFCSIKAIKELILKSGGTI
ncbi:acyl carrier protein [Arcobacter cloacae]|uniref:Acyl carrier protein n=1 Tax=Arcobacter cloacae TaxID=1054034 RepID=A0A4Q0ZLG7_9BACT|nr:acyl carrier protein [Arcobacter cloacae]RXJ84378.1 acyl carrier protein [Arcobacter cloacae]